MRSGRLNEALGDHKASCCVPLSSRLRDMRVFFDGSGVQNKITPSHSHHRMLTGRGISIQALAAVP